MRHSTVSAIVLTLHGVRRDAESVEFLRDIAAAQYAIGTERLAQLLDGMNPKASCTVRELAVKTVGDFRILTFDDGLISDFVTVFPLLLSRQVRATFFVSAEHVGGDGFASPSQLMEMTGADMEIGSHGLTHRYLVTMSRRDALREIQESKARLEQMLGAEVVSFAPVGGHFRNWMVGAAAEAGYRAFATMIPGRTTMPDGLLLLNRNHIQAHHSARYVSRLLSGQRGILLTNRVRYFLLKQPKNWLGLRRYDRLKDVVMRRFSDGSATSGADGQ